MRRRALRDLGTILGVVVILAGVVFYNSTTRRSSLKEQMIAWRQSLEKKQQTEGVELLSWDLLQKTKGGVRSGPTFDEGLSGYRDAIVNLMGFMVPLETYRKMTEFLFLPMPIQCYFCQAPPMRDVVLVKMDTGKEVDLYEEPVVISGVLTLNEGKGTKFFYTINQAQWGPAEKGLAYKKKTPSVEHRAHMQNQLTDEKLYEGVEPPTATPSE